MLSQKKKKIYMKYNGGTTPNKTRAIEPYEWKDGSHKYFHIMNQKKRQTIYV